MSNRKNWDTFNIHKLPKTVAAFNNEHWDNVSDLSNEINNELLKDSTTITTHQQNNIWVNEPIKFKYNNKINNTNNENINKIQDKRIDHQIISDTKAHNISNIFDSNIIFAESIELIREQSESKNQPDEEKSTATSYQPEKYDELMNALGNNNGLNITPNLSHWFIITAEEDMTFYQYCKAICFCDWWKRGDTPTICDISDIDGIWIELKWNPKTDLLIIEAQCDINIYPRFNITKCPINPFIVIFKQYHPTDYNITPLLQ